MMRSAEDQVLQGAGPDGSDLTVPSIITRNLQTFITVKNNETIVLGGLNQYRDTKTVTGIPLSVTFRELDGSSPAEKSRKVNPNYCVHSDFHR